MSVETCEAFRRVLVALVVALPLLATTCHGQTVEQNLETHRRIQARIAARERALRDARELARMDEWNRLHPSYVIITGPPTVAQQIARQTELAEERRRAAVAKRQYRNHRSLLAARRQQGAP